MEPSSHHVFICYGSLSARATVLLVNALPVEQEVVVFSYVKIREAKSWPRSRRVFFLDVDWAALNEIGKVSKVARWFAASLREAQLPVQTNIFAYFPHPFELPGNYFAFQERRVVVRSMLPDGLINFVNRELRSEHLLGRCRLMVRGYLRYFFALYYGLRYSLCHSGHLTQFNSVQYQATYTFGERGIFSRAGVLKTLPLPKPAECLEVENEKVIFVDQELGEIAGDELIAKLRSSMVLRLRQELSRLQADLLYRPHPRGKNRFQELKTALPEFNVILESSSLSLEARAQAPDIKLVMSFFSTSLFLLASAKLCDCKALLPSPELSVNSTYCHEIEAALRAAGVEVQLVS